MVRFTLTLISPENLAQLCYSLIVYNTGYVLNSPNMKISFATYYFDLSGNTTTHINFHPIFQNSMMLGLMNFKIGN
jgi:hypothetical protein